MNIQPKIRWYHSPVPKEVLKNLTERSDAKGFIQILSQLVLTTIAGIISYISFQRLPLWASIPIFSVYATFYSFLGFAGAGHELSHRTVFKTKFWNEFFMIIVSFLSWSDYVFFRASHTRHHQYTVHKGLDLEVELPLKYRRKTWFFMFTFNLPGLINNLKTIIRRSLGILTGEWEKRLYPVNNKKERQRLFAWSRILLIGHLTLAILFVLSGQWTLLLLITFAQYFCGWLNHLCGFPQHVGLQPNVPDFRLCCRTVILNPVFAFFYWQMNYHIEHHMYAGVPFYNLKKLHEAIKDDVPTPYGGLRAAWKDMLVIINKQEKDPSYFYVPTLPSSK
jgi:fatty acid desaturase